MKMMQFLRFSAFLTFLETINFSFNTTCSAFIFNHAAKSYVKWAIDLLMKFWTSNPPLGEVIIPAFSKTLSWSSQYHLCCRSLQTKYLRQGVDNYLGWYLRAIGWIVNRLQPCLIKFCVSQSLKLIGRVLRCPLCGIPISPQWKAHSLTFCCLLN